MKGPNHLFAVSVNEVTFSQWGYCVQQERCSEHHPDDERGHGDMPVINVSPEDAQKYAKWLSQETGRKYQYLLSEQLLPEHMLTKLTEATKEYEDRATYFVYTGTDTKRAIAVGLLPPNEFGLRNIGFRVATTVPSRESAAEEDKGLRTDSTTTTVISKESAATK